MHTEQKKALEINNKPIKYAQNSVNYNRPYVFRLSPIDINEIMPIYHHTPPGYYERNEELYDSVKEFMPSSELFSAVGLFLPRLMRQKLVLDEALVPKDSAIREAVLGRESILEESKK